jgi:hypothetical protein
MREISGVFGVYGIEVCPRPPPAARARFTPNSHQLY